VPQIRHVRTASYAPSSGCVRVVGKESEHRLPQLSHPRHQIPEPRTLRIDWYAGMNRSLETICDEILVLAAQSGDAAAFEALLRRWLPVMRRHAFRLTGNAAAAEDVSQDACLALVSALKHLHDPARAHGWMLRIVTHKAADWVRHQRRDRQLTRTIQSREPCTPSPAVNDAQSDSETHERASQIRAACMLLPIDLRAIVSLYYGENMSIASIAQAMDVPLGTVKSRLHEARAQLKAFLERTSA